MTTTTKQRVPSDFPVKPLKRGDKAVDRATCGTCGRSWDDAIPTSYTPAPSARCPFEAFHDYDDSDDFDAAPATTQEPDDCEFDHQHPHEWYCTVHASLEIQAKEPVSCSIAKELTEATKRTTQPPHTPTPWTFHRFTRNKSAKTENLCIFGAQIAGQPYKVVIGAHGGVGSENDARFIVRAVNNHDKLVSFVEYVRDFYQQNFDVMPVAFQTVDSEAGAVLAEVEK